MGNGAVRGGRPGALAEPIDVAALVAEPGVRSFPKPFLGHEALEASEEPCPLACSEGECLLFLERAQGVKGQPFVRAIAELEDGTLLGRVAEWPAKRCDQTPCWYSAQPLGFAIAGHRSAVLRLELWDRRRLLGSLAVPLRELQEHRSVTQMLSAVAAKGSAPSSLSFQLLDARALHCRRTVFFVRHAESLWNCARRQGHWHTMVRDTDHPLSAAGRAQAEELARRLAALETRRDPATAPLLLPDCVYASPLTRAVQTAVIALGPCMEGAQTPSELVLMANAREKQNRGGRDTHSKKLGPAILEHALDKLRELYREEETQVLEAFQRLRYDLSEVRDRWWCEGSSETPAQLQARLNEFMSQLLFSPHRTIVVVGHSHFFRAVFRSFLCSDFKSKRPEAAGDLCERKLVNCGVARLDLDPRRGLADGPIVQAAMVLGPGGARATGLQV